MTDNKSTEVPTWNPPPVIEELYAQAAGNAFAAINAPTAGARDDKEVPRGSAPFQFYSLATPNGTIFVMLAMDNIFCS